MNDAAWHIRATAWELAALSFRYPSDDELAGAVASGEWGAAMCEIATALDLVLPQGCAASADASGDGAALLRELRPEATRLFVGAPDPVCSPYEGVWRASDDGVQALLFVNPHSMEVERFAKACGLGRPEGTNEPLDHVATECELLSCLATRAAAGDESAQTSYAAFLTEHARVWMPRFADAVASESRIPFYRQAAAYLGALVA